MKICWPTQSPVSAGVQETESTKRTRASPTAQTREKCGASLAASNFVDSSPQARVILKIQPINTSCG
jgi:hypothetical protein